MSDGDFQMEDRIYLPFTFEDEVIEPEQYLIWHQLKDEYEIEQYLKEYARRINII
jgi:hypothetical protein